MEAAGFRENVAVSLYLWNVAIGQAFHFPLQCVEIALRNAISSALREKLGADWWSARLGRDVLGVDRCVDIDKAAHRLRRKYGVEPHGDQIVASLMLGFWAAMLKRQYNEPIWDDSAAFSFPVLWRILNMGKPILSQRLLRFRETLSVMSIFDWRGLYLWPTRIL